MGGLRGRCWALALCLCLLREALAVPSGTAVVCRSEFTKFLFVKSVHTWVNHSQNCTQPSCPYSGPASYQKVGFGCTWQQPIGPGYLRDEDAPGIGPHFCVDPIPSTLTTGACSRASVQTLVSVGWGDGWKSPYLFTAAVRGCKGLNSQSDCRPDRVSNVCWTFTCAWADCAPFKTPLVCPGRNLTATALSAYAPEPTRLPPPPEWRCSASKWRDGRHCDCHCGEFDPDCWDQSLPSRGCPRASDVCLYPGDVCADRNRTLTDRKVLRYEQDGERVWDEDYVPRFGHYGKPLYGVPAGWTCPPHYYGSGDGCDSRMGEYVEGFAGCGEPLDPDCEAQAPPHAALVSFLSARA